MTPTLRPAMANDAAACAAILSEWVAETPWFPKLHSPAGDLAFVTRRITSPEFDVAVAGTKSLSEQPAGFLILEEDYVACLYVATANRGQGIGRRLLDHAKAARPDGLCLWTFQANTGARRFYSREGMVADRFTGGQDNDEGLPDVLFRWTPAIAPRERPTP